jgi:general secretion pathway protein E
MISGKAVETDIFRVARTNGMKTLLEDGLMKAIKGITTLEEVLSVTMEGEEI